MIGNIKLAWVGVLGLAMLVGAAVAQTPVTPTVTPDQARALIAEQRDFITKMSRGEINGDSYKVRWFVSVRLYPDGRGETTLGADDVAHYTTIRGLAASARFLSYVDTAVDPGLRAAIDQAFVAFLGQVNHAGQNPASVDNYLNNVAKPLKAQQMQRILDLLGRLNLALTTIATNANIADRPAAVGASSAATGTTAAAPAQPTPTQPTHAQPTGPSLLGQTSGTATPAGVTQPAVPTGQPAAPGTAVPGAIAGQPAPNPGQILPGQPPLYPPFPGGGPITIVIQGVSINQLGPLLNFLIALLQAMSRAQFAAQPPRNPDPYALERSLYGTGGFVDQSGRAMGLRPGVIPMRLAISIRTK